LLRFNDRTDRELPAGEFVHHLGAALRAATFTATFFAGLFEEFPLAQFLLDARVFDKLPEPTNCVLD
jgi:hypothetical protein